jgi:hypothetical protein
MIPPTDRSIMARNGNNGSTNDKTEFVRNLDHDLEQREEVLERDINQHEIAIEVKGEELKRIRAARKPLA